MAMPDVSADDLVDQLRDDFARRIRSAVTDLPAHQALQLADALCQVQLDVLAGQRVKYRVRAAPDGEAIAEAWRRGGSLGEIQRAFSISRTTAYKFHPSRAAGARHHE